jgi:transposase
MQIQQIIGADISKKSIDFAIHHLGVHLQVTNDQEGFSGLIRWMKKQKVDFSKALVVMEHTGIYSYRLEQFLHQKSLLFTKVPGLQIKLSMGMVRGKTDKVDAIRIARFGFEKRFDLKPVPLRDAAIERLKMLSTTKDKLVRTRASLLTSVNEYQKVCGLKDSDLIVTSQRKLIKEMSKQINKLETEIESIMDKSPNIKNNYTLLMSVKGVGKVVALNTILKTENFTRFRDGRKFACFCGTAPFEHRSGSSIKGRTKISHLADKGMKTLLDLAAKSAIQYDEELNQFYQARIKKGKNKKSTINVVRNKIIYRMFAVIKRQSPFIPDYLQAA